jgi:hypothetical protein
MTKLSLFVLSLSSLVAASSFASDLRFEGFKHPKEKNEALRGKCTATITLDDKGEVERVTMDILDPKAKHPRDSMRAEETYFANSKSNWKFERDSANRLKSIKRTSDVTDTLFKDVIEIKDLHKDQIKIKIVTVFGLIDDVFGVPFTQSCDGLKKVPAPLPTPVPAVPAIEYKNGLSPEDLESISGKSGSAS